MAMFGNWAQQDPNAITTTLGNGFAPNSFAGPAQGQAPSLQQQLPAPPAPVDDWQAPKWASAVGLIGDALQQAGGGKATYAPLLIQQRQQVYADRKQQQQQYLEYQRQAALATQQQAAARALEEYKLTHKAPTEDSFTRALAAAGIQPGSQEYINLARKRAEMLTNPVQLVSDGLGGYTAVRPQSQATTAPTGPAVGEVQDGYRFLGGDPSKQSSWAKADAPSIQNTPAPQLGSNGMPSAISPQQYQAIVGQMGKAQTDAWLQRNGVTVGNF